MLNKSYRLNVQRIPLSYDIPYKKVNFEQFKELHLDLLENQNKLKINPPKPLFIRKPLTPPTEEETENEIINDLENIYLSSSSKNQEDIFTDEEENNDLLSDEENEEKQPENIYERNMENKNEMKNENNSLPNIELTEEKNPEQEKEELLYKLNKLKTKYSKYDKLKYINIPDFSEFSDLDTLKKCYRNNHRIISLQSNIESYKNFLNKGMSGMEFLCTYFLGLNMNGLSQHHYSNSNQYDDLLEEFGEKNYSPVGSSIPVELRLIGLILFSTGTFYVQKNQQHMMGNVMNNMMGGMGENTNPQAKTKMRGPTINPEDLNYNSGSESD